MTKRYRLLSGRFPVVALVLIAMMLASGVALAGSPSDKECCAAAEDERCDECEKECKTATLAKIVITGSLEDALPPTIPFGPTPIYFKKLIDIIELAAYDEDIDGMLLEVSSPAIGNAKVRELRSALNAFKYSGKKIYAYPESIGLKDLTLLSTCDYLALPESGIVMIPGFSIEALYYKDLFEKIGFRMVVDHIGDYKSAYENFHLDGMSNELREVLGCILDEFYNSSVSMIAQSRGIPESTVKEAIDKALIDTETAKSLGLIDAVVYKDQFDAHLKKDLKVDEIEVDTKYGRDSLDLDTTNFFALFTQIMSSMSDDSKSRSKNPKIAIIYASGPIHSGKNSVDPFSQSHTIGSDTLVAAINDAADDETVKAIVMRVDSPGGSGLASDLIWRAQCEAKKKKKPLIVSMADVAGSGGYYIAMAADVILAEPGTITGSIGVVSAMPNVHGSLQKLGIKVESLSRGKNAAMLSAFARPEEVDLSLLTRYMEKFYWDFVDKVAEGRKMTRGQVHKLAQGRVWTGRQAKENGLIDEIGSLNDAINVARAMAGLTNADNWETLELPESPDFFDALSESMGLKTRIQAVAGMAGLEWGLLGTIPELQQALSNLTSFINLAREETILYMMPTEIIVR